MKVSTAMLLLLVVLLLNAQPAPCKDVPGKCYEELCPQSFVPVCAYQSCNKFKTFSNDCYVRRYNCLHNTEYKVIASLGCVKDTA